MPRTVGEILTRSMRVATVLGAAETMDPNDASDALLALNQMLDAWQAERLYAYQIIERAAPLTAGVGAYTVGPSATINVPRPVRIEWAFTRDTENYDRQLSIVPDQVWATIFLKSLGNNFPTVLYYEPGFPQGTINLWQLPTTGLTLHFGAWVPLTEFADLNVSVALPPGYELAIVYSLAEYLCIEYEKPISGAMAQKAQMSRANIQQNNLPDPRIGCEFTGANTSLTPYWRIAAGDF